MICILYFKCMKYVYKTEIKKTVCIVTRLNHARLLEDMSF